jgi:exosortase E/protease (VPEID-CTERM system)
LLSATTGTARLGVKRLAPGFPRGADAGVRTVRTAAWLLLIAGECALTSALIDVKSQLPAAAASVLYPLGLLRLVLLSTPFLCLLTWPYRRRLWTDWQAAQTRHDPFRPLLVNLACVAALALASVALPASRWVFGLEVALLGAVALSALAIDVGLGTLGRIVSAHLWQAVTALALGAGALALSELAMSSGPALAGGTIDLAWLTWRLSAAILSLYEPQLVIDAAERSLAIGEFKVIVVESCAGYEGLALVAAFTTFYLLALRRQWRFPAAFTLYPVGLGAVWLLNSARIAALASIGGHLAPEVAIRGFHSRAGWITFLAVCMAELWLAPRLLTIGSGVTGRAAVDARAPEAIINAHLLPFIVLMAGSLLMAAASPSSAPLYPLVAAAVAGVLVAVRRHLGDLRPAMPSLSGAAGLVVGGAWIATAPDPAVPPELGSWLAGLAPTEATFWLATRGLGAIILVPFAEELAFRGFLYRRLIGARFDLVAMSRFSALALLASSLLFGVLHDRWLAATVSGIIFALLMQRRGRIGDAILAHALANAVIFAWAVAWQHWSLL